MLCLWLVTCVVSLAQEGESTTQTDQASDSKPTDPPQEKTSATGGDGKTEQKPKSAAATGNSAPTDKGAQQAVSDKKPAPKLTKLLEENFAKTWKLFAAEEGVKVEDVWKINKTEMGNILVCTGKPKGYLRTIRPYENYRLSFEFRYPMDENGNSGVLLHIEGKDKIWPDGVQVQLHRPTAGSILPCGNRQTRYQIHTTKLTLLHNKWNSCEIDVRDDAVEVTINEKAVGPLKYLEPSTGFIALQSEGSEVHFRNINVLEYPVAKKPAALVQDGTRTETPTTGGDKDDSPDEGKTVEDKDHDDQTDTASGGE